MLTDIFAARYQKSTLWTRFEERDRRFLVQAWGQIAELFPDSHTASKEALTSVHDRLATELGVLELSKKHYPHNYNMVGTYPIATVCKNFLLGDHEAPTDRFMKARLSFIELAFRVKASALKKELVGLDSRIKVEGTRRVSRFPTGARLPGKPADGLRALKELKEEAFNNAVLELNARMQQAEYPLNYHNGYIQRSSDTTIASEVGASFWSLVADPIWKNVDLDMKEAIDQRDSGGRDPAIYAARALESTIKIISDKLGLTTGGEKGAHSYLDNLGSKRGQQFIADWEREMLKEFFSKIRNPFGHGAGSQPMPSLSTQQTDWAVRTCMIWVSSLITRMP